MRGKLHSHNENNMFDGPVLPLMFKIALPFMAGIFFNSLYNIINIIWLSRIDLNDPSYVGGVGLVFPVVSLAIAINNGLTVGVNSLTARSIGKKDTVVLQVIPKAGLCIAFVFSILMLGSVYVCGPQIVRLLGAEKGYYTSALDYLYYITPSAIGLFFSAVFCGILQGEGDMKSVMLSMCIGTIANVILDPILIFGLGMKVKGAGLATSISQNLGLLYLIFIFIKRRKPMAGKQRNWFRLSSSEFSVMYQIMNVGFLQTISLLTVSLSSLVANNIAAHIDAAAVTGFTIAGRTDQIVFTPIFAIGAALVTMIGQNYGRGCYERLREIWRVSLIATFVVCTGIVTIMFFTSDWFMPFFSDVPKVIRYGVLQVKLVDYSFIFGGITVTGRSLFQGMGKGFPAFFLTVSRFFIFTVLFMILFVYVFGLGIWGVWIGYITGNVFSGLIAIMWVDKTLKRLVNKTV